ncbi:MULTISPECIES: hypothetical protein [Ralstonia solanacearum species complex]|uniref:hypothetical protein n=1 Tax=Ralstonia solanacearum species complex TaxID=3116862 RepID=UPI000E584489|nr:hypothetical protein [Ralstonia solanacearum]BEU73046.1 hypothetical protein MAFF211271_26010 [Ralstonia pseudosolanacearum]AXV77859.1 hypothetical protein CJO76_13335 [Ralstonia solanacearum]AXV91884.1 hypothetical protein CJO79_13315 [Ralstonia solanacearum]AXW19972.1 hypothetical protein CJO85_13370 [Ralstonia solanacearum]AXW76770.1 hypothetical protein CJO97_13305 [Ralstonia solanacearum]
MRLFRSSFPHLRWLACLLAVLLLFGQQGALRHALSHFPHGSEGGTEISAARVPAGKAGERASHTGTEHAACLQCAAFAALAAALPMLAIFRLRNTRRWHFPSVGPGACALVFPVPVRSRDPPFGL